jgi:hypothetical protein
MTLRQMILVIVFFIILSVFKLIALIIMLVRTHCLIREVRSLLSAIKKEKEIHEDTVHKSSDSSK